MNNSHKHLSALVAFLVMAAMAAPAASAQSLESPSLDGYIDQNAQVQAQIESQSGGPSEDPGTQAAGVDPVQASASDELPFTGLDVGLLAVAGGSLLLMGFGMRRLTRGPDSA